MFSDDNEITKDLARAKKFFEDIISFTAGPYTLDEIIANRKDSINILDVREYDDYTSGHIPYAVHIPYKETEKHLELFDKSKVTIVYTYSDTCPRAYKTALELIKNHYPAVVLRGGFKSWKKFDFDIIKTDSDDNPDTDKQN